ncbi:hypothetical protein LINPERPRIM_LOCUS21368 [Linum perenne]
MNKVLPILQQSTRSLVLVMSPNCLLTCLSLIVARQPLPSLMKLKPGSKTPSMDVSPTSLLFSNR